MVNWKYSLKPSYNYNSIAYGNNGVFIAVGNNVINRSEDNGLTWKDVFPSATSLQGVIWSSITYGDNGYVAVGIDAGGVVSKVMNSTDGSSSASWKDVSPNDVDLQGVNWDSITYGDNGYVAIGGANGGVSKVMISTNGSSSASWKDVSPTEIGLRNVRWRSITYGDNGYVVVGGDFVDDVFVCKVMISTNGSSWEDVSPNDVGLRNVFWMSITYGDNGYVVVGYAYDVVDGVEVFVGKVMISTNGSSWEDVSPNDIGLQGVTWSSITYGDNGYIAVGNINLGIAGFGVGKVMISTNGSSSDSWIDVSPSATGLQDVIWSSITYGLNRYVAVGNDTFMDGVGKVMISTNGSSSDSWIDVSPSPTSFPGVIWSSITYGDNGYISVGRDFVDDVFVGKVMISNNGSSSASWKDVSPSDTGLRDVRWTSITYGDNGYVAIGDANDVGKVMISTNGSSSDSWKDVSPSPTSFPLVSWSSITYGNNGYVAVGGAYGDVGKVMISTNASSFDSWEDVSPNEDGLRNVNWHSITYGDNGYIAVGNDFGGVFGGKVMISTDGSSWTAISPNKTGLTGVFWNSITYGDNGYVAVGYFGDIGKVMISTDGSSSDSWIDVSPNDAGLRDINWHSITYGVNGYVAVGVDFDNITSKVMISTNGVNWSLSEYPHVSGKSIWNSITYGNGRYVIVGSASIYSVNQPTIIGYRRILMRP